MTKICTKCGEALPATPEYFSSRKRNKDGLHELCKTCRTARDKAYRHEHIDRYHQATKAWKEANRERIDALNAAYAASHKARKSQTNKAWHERNREHKNATVKAWAEQNKDRRYKTITAWREEHKEQYAAILRRYKKANPEKVAMFAERRRSRKNNLPSTLTKEEWKATKEYFENQCAYCGVSGNLAQEHLIAVANGGGYIKENIIPACRRCNSSKKDKLFELWYPAQAFYSPEREAKILRAVGRNATQQSTGSY